MGNFLKVLATFFLTKVAQMVCDFGGCFEKPFFLSRTELGHVCKKCVSLIPTSDHTDAKAVSFRPKSLIFCCKGS